jgi:hypothetical protein
MNQTKADGLLEEGCRRGVLGQILEEYVAFCHMQDNATSSERKGRSGTRAERFPNLAGFCRYLGCSTEEWFAMESAHPTEFGRLRATLEDEALNAAMSPTVIAAYLKKRLGYDKEMNDGEGALTVQFEHDIFSDGE